MKILKTIGIVLLIIVILFLLIALFLPKKVYIEESATINAPTEIIFNQINNFTNWPNWSPFDDDDPEMTTTLEGPAVGVGALMKWISKKQGNGSMLLTEISANEYIKADLMFEGYSKSLVSWKFEKSENDVKVIWGIEMTDMPYPIGRWMGLFMGKMMRPSFQKGLNDLKTYCEKEALIPVSKWKTAEVIEKDVAPYIALTVKDSCTVDGFSKKFEEIFGMISMYMTKMKLEQSGAPFSIYYTWNPQGITVFEAGIPVNKKIAGKGRILFKEIAGCKTVMTSQFGPYETSGNAHDAIDKFIKANNKTCIGAPWEVYVTDPMTESDTAKWETQVYYPVN